MKGEEELRRKGKKQKKTNAKEPRLLKMLPVRRLSSFLIITCVRCCDCVPWIWRLSPLVCLCRFGYSIQFGSSVHLQSPFLSKDLRLNSVCDGSVSLGFLFCCFCFALPLSTLTLLSLYRVQCSHPSNFYCLSILRMRSNGEKNKISETKMQFFFFLFRWLNVFSCRSAASHIHSTQILLEYIYIYILVRSHSMCPRRRSLYRVRDTPAQLARNKMWSAKKPIWSLRFLWSSNKTERKTVSDECFEKERKKNPLVLSFAWPLSEWLWICWALARCWIHAHLQKIIFPWNTLATWSRRMHVHMTDTVMK